MAPPVPAASGTVLREVLRQPQWFLGLLILTAIENSLLTGTFWESVPASFKLAGSVYALCSAAAFAMAALLAKRSSAWTLMSSAYGRCAIGFAAGVALLAAASVLPASVATSAAVISAALMPLCYVPLVLSWVALLAKLPIARTFACFSLAYAGGCVVSLVIVLLDPHWLVELIMAVAALATVPLFGSRLTGVPEEESRPVVARGSFPLRPVVICGVVAFVTTFLQNCNTVGDVPLSIFAGAALTIVILGVFILRSRTDLMGLQQVSLVLAVAACLSIPFAGTAVGNLGMALSMTANLLFLVFAETVLCGISLRYGFNAPWLIGVSLSVMAATSFVAVGTCELFRAAAPAFEESTLIAAIMAVAVLALFLRFVTEADVLGSWGMRETAPTGETGLADLRLQTRVFSLSCCYGFTKREEEVCALLAQGHNVAAIEEILVVSNSTAKSHVAHIYKKMGVHSIQEFRAEFNRG